MNKERIDDLIDILGEEYARIENTFVIRNSEQLFKYLDNPKKWKVEQLNHRATFRNEIIGNAREQLRVLNEKAEKVFLLAYKEVDKDTIKVTEKEIIAENLPSNVKKQIKQIKDFNTKQIAKLANQSLKTYTKQVRIIDSLSTPETLYDVVKKQVPKGVENGVKVVYEDGKQFTWKAYMEMNIRTTVHQEMVEHQDKVGAKVNQIFYMCDSFADCAPDHADYQGKIYYNEECDIPPEVQAYIDSHGIQSKQQVQYGEPYLTTRQNCRHNFHAITTDEVMSMSSDDILEKENLKHGEYKESNYQALQQQRYNERQIRKWKMQLENAKRIRQETRLKDSVDLKKARSKVWEWQAKQRQLMKENKEVLHRQYDRENARVIVNDLGVKYDYKVVDGQLEKK